MKMLRRGEKMNYKVIDQKKILSEWCFQAFFRRLQMFDIHDSKD